MKTIQPSARHLKAKRLVITDLLALEENGEVAFGEISQENASGKAFLQNDASTTGDACRFYNKGGHHGATQRGSLTEQPTLRRAGASGPGAGHPGQLPPERRSREQFRP